MRAEWTASGACTNGSIAHRRGATKRAYGGAATTSTTRAERSRYGFRASFPASVFWHLSAGLRCQRVANDCLVRVHDGNGRDADARRLDDVDGVDADARTDMVR